MTANGWLGALSLLGPVATGVAAVVALVVGIATVRQRDRADRREQWWRRAEWALALTLSDDREQMSQGYAVLAFLARSDLATRRARSARVARESGVEGAAVAGSRWQQPGSGP
jgi:hypothetical protein